MTIKPETDRIRKPHRSVRKHKLRKKRSPRIIREFAAGPLEGLRLEFDRDHPVYPRRWILTFKGILVQVSVGFPQQAWDRLVKFNSAGIQIEQLVTQEEIDKERRVFRALTRREIFWGSERIRRR